MMVSMEEDGAAAPAGGVPTEAAAIHASGGAEATGGRPRRRWRWYVLGTAVVGAVVLVAVGAAGGFKARRAGGDSSQAAAGAGAAVPLAASDGPPPPVLSPGGAGDALRSPTSSSVLPSKQTTTRAPSIVPATNSSDSTAGAKAAPESLLELLQALQQEAVEGDKKYITTDYFGNEIPKENRPGQFAHLTGAPTPTILDDGAPVCHVENSIELRQAIMFKSCPLITLAPVSNDEGELEQDRDDDDPLVEGEVDESHANDGAYHIFTEIIVKRAVTLQGDPLLMPLIDCQLSVRCFRVRRGGRLDMRYIQMNTGKGEVEPRITGVDMDATLAGPVGNKINVVRGGSVLYEPGTTGGTYVGCYFLGDEGSADEVEEAIERSLGVLGIRIYGGHFFVAGGRLDFIGCLFYDMEILTPMTDRLRFGDDIFIIGGEVYMTGCVTFYTSIIGLDAGIGLNIHVQAGSLFMTGCTLTINNGLSITATVGQAVFVGGGLFIFTASNAMFNSGVEAFNGFGALATMGGVQVLTAAGIQDVYAILGAFGIGFDLGLAAGVVVTTNCGINQFLGLIYAGMLGGFACNLAGLYLAEHSPFISNVGQGAEAGGGGYVYTAAGLNSFQFCPLYVTAGTWAAFMAGAYIGLPAGWMVFIYSPIVGISGIEVYYGGIGGSIFVGAGAAVMGRSPLIELIAIVNLHADFWIMGSCEPYVEAWADGPITLYVGGYGCNVTEAEELAFEDGEPIESGRLGGEWVSKLEHYRHENHKAREAKKHGGENHSAEGGGHRQRRWLNRRGRSRRGLSQQQQVPIVRVLQEEQQEPAVAAAGGAFTPLGATFEKPAFLAYGVSPRRRRDAQDAAATTGTATAEEEGEEDMAMVDPTEDEVVAAVFSPRVLEGMRALQAQYQAVKARLAGGDGSVIDPVTVHLESAPEGFCGVCGADSVEGPGAVDCAVEPHCDAEFTGFAALALQEAAPIAGKRLFGDPGSASATAAASPVAARATLGLDQEEAQEASAPAASLDFPSPSAFDALGEGTRRALETAVTAPPADPSSSAPSSSSTERFVLTAKIDVGTDPGYPRINATHIRDAVYALLGRDVSDPLHPVVGDEAVQIQVFSAGVEDEVFQSWYPELEAESLLRYRGDGSGNADDVGLGDLDVQRFKAVILSTSRLQARRALRALGQDPARRIRHLQEERIEDGVVEGDEVVEENPEWGAAIEGYLTGPEVGAEGVRAVAVGFERSVYIPPYDTELFLQEAGPEPVGHGNGNLGSYSVMLIDTAAAAFPVQRDVGYKKEYEVRLSGFPKHSVVAVQALRIEEEDGEEDEDVTTRPMATVSTDEDGAASFKWRFFALGFPDGDYEVKATVVKTGAFGLSPLYSLTKAPRRRLVGSRMWI